MNDSKKKVINYDSKQIDSDIFEGSFDQVIDNLKELKENYQSKLPLSHWCKLEWENSGMMIVKNYIYNSIVTRQMKNFNLGFIKNLVKRI